ncbi:MAG TPA: ATP-binding protein [Polyangiaceae bacterium]|nr:ATP-binding protein [Polyangiaceae bacterium]
MKSLSIPRAPLLVDSMGTRERDGAAKSAPNHETSLGLAWIVRLRWGTLGGQVAALAVAHFALAIQLPILALLPSMLVLALSNFALMHTLGQRTFPSHFIGALLLIDVCLLTASLSFTGGASNPFSAFFVVYVALAALVLGRDWAMTLVAFTSLCFGALFWVPAAWLGPHAHHVATPQHLQGMWTAYALSACFVAYFVSKIANALRERDRRIFDLKRYAAATERLASLSTMAAGAAHELGTPLATIAVASSELADGLRANADPASLLSEAHSIRKEVNRCRELLDRLAAGAGVGAGERLEFHALSEVLENLHKELGTERAKRLVLTCRAPAQTRLRVPLRALTQVLVNLVDNGLYAQRIGGNDAAIELELDLRTGQSSASQLGFRVLDRGVGLSSSELGRIGEPFFTTKPQGEGMGLGLYLVRRLAQDLEGDFSIGARAGGGTEALLALPLDPVNARRETEQMAGTSTLNPSVLESSMARRECGARAAPPRVSVPESRRAARDV